MMTDTTRTWYLVAGPRSSGKTTFINWCKKEPNLPDGLHELSQIVNQEPMYFMDLDQVSGTEETVLVHLDMVTPFAEARFGAGDDMSEQISASRVWDYGQSCFLKGGTRTHILLLNVPRKVALRRYLDRKIRNNEMEVRTTLMQLYSDAYGDGPYKQLYIAWDGVWDDLPCPTLWDVSEMGSKYQITLRNRTERM